MKVQNKIKFFIFIAIATVLLAIFASNYTSATEIKDACVDTNTGNITIIYSNGVGMVIQTYNSDGEKIFGQTINNTQGGGAMYAEYVGSNLYVYLSRSDILYAFDQEMNQISKESDPDRDSDLMESIIDSEWSGWEKSGRTRQYVNGNTEYYYVTSSFWERIVGAGSCEMLIKDTNGNSKQIFHSNKLK